MVDGYVLANGNTILVKSQTNPAENGIYVFNGTTSLLTRAATALRATMPAGGVILYNGIFAFDETPSMSKGQLMGCKAGIALQNRPVRYST